MGEALRHRRLGTRLRPQLLPGLLTSASAAAPKNLAVTHGGTTPQSRSANVILPDMRVYVGGGA
jgi:hypothetical protein